MWTFISHLNPILNTTRLKIKMQIEMKWYILMSVLKRLRQIATLKYKSRSETGLLNTSLNHLRLRTARGGGIVAVHDGQHGVGEADLAAEHLPRLVADHRGRHRDGGHGGRLEDGRLAAFFQAVELQVFGELFLL